MDLGLSPAVAPRCVSCCMRCRQSGQSRPHCILELVPHRISSHTMLNLDLTLNFGFRQPPHPSRPLHSVYILQNLPSGVLAIIPSFVCRCQLGVYTSASGQDPGFYTTHTGMFDTGLILACFYCPLVSLYQGRRCWRFALHYSKRKICSHKRGVPSLQRLRSIGQTAYLRSYCIVLVSGTTSLGDHRDVLILVESVPARSVTSTL